MMWAAVLMVLGQGAIIGTLLYFVRTFGAYTEALLQAQQSNVLIHEHLVREIEELRKAKERAFLPTVAAAREVA